MSKELFDKFYKRVVKESILKAILGGLAIGFMVDFVFALVTVFFTTHFNLWYVIALAVGLGVGAISGVILYFTAFRPTASAIARRVDALGLEQRLVTMLELEKDESYIAMRQREDAKAKMKGISPKALKISVTKTLVALAIIVSVLGVSMTTVNAVVTQNNYVPPPEFSPEDGGESFEPPEETPDEPERWVVVSYVVNNSQGGWIEGDTDQIVVYGGSTTPVIARPEEGYMFVGWREDESMIPERYETDVRTNRVFTAVFMVFDDEPEGGKVEC